MTSLFRSLFKGKFPEYGEFETALEDLRGHGLMIVDNVGKAFAPEFDEFAAKQAEPVKPGITQISSHGKRQVKVLQHLFTAMAGLPQEMASLRDLNSEKEKELSELHAAQNQSKKSIVELQKADEALQRARQKGIAAEITRCEQKSDACRYKSEQDSRAVEALQQKFEGYLNNYRGRFVDTMADKLSNAVDEKMKELRELSSIAQAIMDAAATISEYEDRSVPVMKQQLEQLNSETIV